MRGGTFYGPVTGKSESPRAAPSPTALSALPAAPAVFTGREDEVAELLGALDPEVGGGSESVLISAVSGLGGVGKTALALCVAHEARGRGWFAGGALFVDLRGYDDVPVTADQAVLALLRALGVGDADLPPTADEQYARYRAELSSRESVLIVLDNASDPAQIARLLPGEGSGHRVLVTSREVQDSLPVRQFRVDGLTPDASRKLIDRSLRQYDPGDRRVAEEPEAVRQLSELCGHLPLALLIVSALLRRGRQRPVATLVSRLNVASDRVRALKFRGVDQYRKELSLRPVLDEMYARLESEPELARVFRLLGQAPGDSIGVEVAASLTGLPLEQLEPYLDDLTACSLLTVFPDGERWQLHDLVRLYAHTVVAEDPGLLDEAAEARSRLVCHYAQRTWSAVAHVQPQADDVPDATFTDRAQAVNWLSAERTGLLAAAQWTDTEDDEQIRDTLLLSHCLGIDLERRRAFHDWVTVAETACQASRRVSDRQVQGMVDSSLGGALLASRRFEEAVDVYRRALGLFEECGDRDGLALAWNNLGLGLREMRRYSEAIEAYGHSARLYGDLGNRRQAAKAHCNLGATLEDLGLLDESLVALEDSLAICMEFGDREVEATIRNSLGIVLRGLGHHIESIASLTHALGLCAELGDWHGRAKSWNNLGLTLKDLGRFDEALSAHTRARSWYVFVEDRRGEALAGANIGVTLRAVGRCEEALSATHQALDLFREFGDEHDIAFAQRNIAAILKAHP
ncbi:tetratricopeptide repeat protein [Streptomyces prunicolor]|uniref:tetratricopeptide repeat protein n=1 Tax=Streptomyces prunicolor TaxID=67348 RepID=UPI00371A2A67